MGKTIRNINKKEKKRMLKEKKRIVIKPRSEYDDIFEEASYRGKSSYKDLTQ